MRIQDYAVIGDCRSAALVSRAGAIEWLCWPRFDSPGLFGALLDPDAGRWALEPVGPWRSVRRYLPDTNILETTFETGSGVMVLLDLMPVASEEEKRALLLPAHEILRIVRCTAGEVALDLHFQPKPDFALERTRFVLAGELGLRMETKHGLLALRTDFPLQVGRDAAHMRMRLRRGESRYLSLTLADRWPAVIPPLGAWSEAALERSVRWWRGWAARLRYDGPGRATVVRSALALKLLVYAPSGAIVAAPTSSLPERIGGPLNWDYRFCWLRDASMTARALFGLGCVEEAQAFVSWLLHTTRLTRPELRIIYDVYGNAPRAERTLEHLSGYAGSRPVRIGNAAALQLQLDVYGEVIEATARLARVSGSIDHETQRMLRAFGDYVARSWQLADEGIWEPRSGRRHNTHSRLLCWTALERLLELNEQGLLARAPVETYTAARDAIRADIEGRAWSSHLSSYASVLDGDSVDASLLLLPWYGFEPADSERMQLTYARVIDELEVGDGLLLRYRSSDSPGEGAFGICCFWAIEHLALAGRLDEACARFRRLCQYASDVGLFAEEIDPATGDALGNFPQAFTHVGLINAALTLAQLGARADDSRAAARPSLAP